MEEPHIARQDGDHLLTASVRGGLTVTDLSGPVPVALGRYRVPGVPFDLIASGDRVLLIVNRYPEPGPAGSGVPDQKARVQLLDVSDPGAIAVLAEESIAGDVSQALHVGDLLLLVTFESGECAGCSARTTTQISAFAADTLQRRGELRFEDASATRALFVEAGARHLLVQRIAASGNPTFQLIEAPDGDAPLRLGGTIEVMAESATASLDDDAGLLRVMARAVKDGPPRILTYAIDAADRDEPIATFELPAPPAGYFANWKVDGARALVYSSGPVVEGVPPADQDAAAPPRTSLQTVDMSDPAAPILGTAFVVEGWLQQLELRGDRIYGLTREGRGELRRLGMFVANAGDPTQPARVDQITLGPITDRIWLAPTQMVIAADEELIAVGGIEAGAETDAFAASTDGIQLFQRVDDKLVQRGRAAGLHPLSFFIQERVVIGVSDYDVWSFDASDLDRPRLLGKQELGRRIKAMRATETSLLRLADPGASSLTTVDRASSQTPDLSESGSEISLTDLASEPAMQDFQLYIWWDEILQMGPITFLSRTTRNYEPGTPESAAATVFGFDFEASPPRLVATVPREPTGDDGYDSYGSNLVVGHALLLGRDTYDPNRETTIAAGELQDRKIGWDVIDVSDPSRPQVRDHFAVPEELARGGFGEGAELVGIDLGHEFWVPGGFLDPDSMLVSGDQAVSQHYVPVEGEPGRVQYYLDRIDVSDPANVHLLPPVSIPGKVIHLDRESGLLVTIEQVEREGHDPDQSECRHPSVFAAENEINCNRYNRVLHTLRLEGDIALPLMQQSLDEQDDSVVAAVSADRVFVLSQELLPEAPDPARLRKLYLHSYGLDGDGMITPLGDVEFEDGINRIHPRLVARGHHALLENGFHMYTLTADGQSPPALVRYDRDGQFCDAVVANDAAWYCSLDWDGVKGMPFSDARR